MRGSMIDWQPIETAPKDGTFILIYFPTDHTINIVQWSEKEKHMGKGTWKIRDSDSYYYHWRPTHWMLLPLSPDEPFASVLNEFKFDRDLLKRPLPKCATKDK